MKRILSVCLIVIFVLTGAGHQTVKQTNPSLPIVHSINAIAVASPVVAASATSTPLPNKIAVASKRTTFKAPAVTAASVLIKDMNTGTVIWRKNVNQQQHMASTTKVITAILALELGNLDDTVTVGKEAVTAGKEGGIKLALNEKIKMRDLVYALLLPSANDAAVAIAEHIAGSQKAFVVLMNQKASKLGAKRTHFSNPHGLDDRLHYSTVTDLATFAEYAMKNPEFAKVVTTKYWTITRTNPKSLCKIENTNELLKSYYGVCGVKTGYTKKAQNCLVVAANRGGSSIMCVVLGVKNRKNLFKESAALLDFGFNVTNP